MGENVRNNEKDLLNNNIILNTLIKSRGKRDPKTKCNYVRKILLETLKATCEEGHVQ